MDKQLTDTDYFKMITGGKYSRMTREEMTKSKPCKKCGSPWRYHGTHNCILCNRRRKRDDNRPRKRGQIRPQFSPNTTLEKMLAQPWRSAKI